MVGAALMIATMAPLHADASSVDAAGWATQYVAKAGAADDYSLLNTYIHVESTGRVMILYAKGPNPDLGFDLRLAHGPRADGSFRTESVDPDDSLITGLPSMAVSARDRPYISYVSGIYADKNYLKYATRTANGWQIEVPDPSMPVGLTSIALRAHNQPVIAYSKAYPADELRLARRSAGGWTTSLVSGERVVALDVAVDGANEPVIAYVAWDGSNYVARVASFDGAGWSFETVGHVASQGIEFGIDLQIDGRGTMHLVYPVLEPKQGMAFAESTGSGWTTGYIATGNLWQPGQALDSTGTAHVVYYNATIGALVYATQEGATWARQKVADSRSESIRIGRLSSLAFDARDVPHIAYYVGNQFKGTTLHYAVASS
jgi:hypothetical protein